MFMYMRCIWAFEGICIAELEFSGARALSICSAVVYSSIALHMI